MSKKQIKTTKEPLIRTVKRTEMTLGAARVLRLCALLLALLAGAVFLLAMGYHPLTIYGTIISGAFRSKIAIQGTVKIIIPLLISSLGVTLAYKMQF